MISDYDPSVDGGVPIGGVPRKRRHTGTILSSSSGTNDSTSDLVDHSYKKTSGGVRGTSKNVAALAEYLIHRFELNHFHRLDSTVPREYCWLGVGQSFLRYRNFIDLLSAQASWVNGI